MTTHRHKPRHPRHQLAGEYPISTGTACIVADPQRDGGYLLEINRVPSTYFVIDSPRTLGFDYMHWIAAALRAWIAPDESPHLLHLGGAGCALPRFAADVWPTSTNEVIEIDDRLHTLIADLFALPCSITIRTAEARTATHAVARRRTLPAPRAIIRDVFAGNTTPRHLTTVEYFRAVREALAPDGLYLANVGDEEKLPTTSAELAGLSKVFTYTAALTTDVMANGAGYGNVVLVAAHKPLDAIAAATGPLYRGAEWVARRIDGTPARRDRPATARS